MIRIAFITGNKEKFNVATSYFRHLPASTIELIQKKIDVPEIQDESVEDIARSSAIWASKKLNTSVIVSDVGLYINSLNGFPGPFIKYVNNWLTSDDLINLMVKHTDRSARFIDSIAYATPEGETVVFSSYTDGKIATAKGGNSSWTIDNVFIPNGHSSTLSQLSPELRRQVWSNDRWEKMAAYIESHSK